MGAVPDMSKADNKDATLTLTLKAKSGYSCREGHQVSANQWSQICAICADGKQRAVITAAPDLLEALQGLINKRNIRQFAPYEVSAARAAISKALGTGEGK